ncbi:hypothetical protein GCM10009565_58650 [Amycolatopsis albidoflavus]
MFLQPDVDVDTVRPQIPVVVLPGVLDRRVERALVNPYYMSVVSYQGIHYEGKHQALVEPNTWLAVQDVLAAPPNHTGEKDRVHLHYLRSTIYCSDCGGRLVLSRYRDRRGEIYGYFLCLKKTRANNCRRPAVSVERIEDGTATFYGSSQIEEEYAEQIRATVRAELATEQAEAARGLQRARAASNKPKTNDRSCLLPTTPVRFLRICWRRRCSVLRVCCLKLKLKSRLRRPPRRTWKRPW